MSSLDSLRRDLLEAREARAGAIARLCAALPAGHALAFLSLNVPGPEKDSPRLDGIFERAHIGLRACSRGCEEGRDALGRWRAVALPVEAVALKHVCVTLEETLPAGRLIDLDVYDRAARPVDRRALGLPPRRCLVCAEPAVDCMRSARHDGTELADAVRRLLSAAETARLAEALVEGARLELELTPKPGLVDRHDNGSHPDLSFELMERSIALLPEYYEELIRLAPATPDTLEACIDAGRRAEERMLAAIGTNAHRGYIFLSGLVLLSGGSRAGIRETAAAIVSGRPAPDDSHGQRARAGHGVGGIIGEALDGLPSVFDHALPALARAEARFGTTDAARHAAMATLMMVVEDTTTLHRCGAQGLERLKRDGRRVLEAIERGDDHVALLERLNDDYRAAGMTMGGVADLLAVAIAIRGARSPIATRQPGPRSKSKSSVAAKTSTPPTPARTSPMRTAGRPRRSYRMDR